MRKESIKIDRTEVAERVVKFYDSDLSDSQVDFDLRLQRIAKYRMWIEPKDWPWENASNLALPDMMEKSLRVQDTLVNATMTQRPVIGAKAVIKENADKESTIDDLIHAQVFGEQKGEDTVGDLSDAFVNDGVFTAFVPWVKEFREVTDVQVFEPIPDELDPGAYFLSLLQQNFPDHNSRLRDNDEWDWLLTNDADRKQASFYTRENGDVELLVKHEVPVYDGPLIVVKDFEQVIVPARSANLQMPSPSNPGGAPHVILVDYPTIDEIKRLAKKNTDGIRFYDLITQEDLDSLENISEDDSSAGERKQKDDFQGETPNTKPEGAKSQNTLTRLMCFDTFDIDGDGIDEDVIFWVLKEHKILLRAKLLTEIYPGSRPRRPLVSKPFIPVRGRWTGISLLEIMEGLHDSIKQFFDQTADAGTISNSPFGFYRASSALKPDIIRMSPGELYPLQDPKRDIEFPNLGNQAQAFGINMIGLLTNMEERLTMIGDLQLGRVPAGRSSALRTASGMAMLQGQGEERPERILRRFFSGLSEIWEQIHELNQVFLPEGKKFRLLGMKRKGEDPFQEIADRETIRGKFQFQFSATVLNTNKGILQQSLVTMLGTFVNDLMLQLGIIQPDGIYRLSRDVAEAFGLDADKYLDEPTPGARSKRIFAEEAVSVIVGDAIPDGEPAEAGGAQEHLQKLVAFSESDDFGHLSPAGVEIFGVYLQEVHGKAVAEAEQQRLMAAAQRFGQQGGQGQPGAPVQSVPGQDELQGQPELQGGSELIDQTLGQ